jgi:hypothetical protein
VSDLCKILAELERKKVSFRFLNVTTPTGSRTDRTRPFVCVAPVWQPLVQALTRVVDVVWRNTVSTDALFKILAATRTGMSADQFQVDVKDWIKPAREPRWQRPCAAARNPEDEDLGKPFGRSEEIRCRLEAGPPNGILLFRNLLHRLVYCLFNDSG